MERLIRIHPTSRVTELNSTQNDLKKGKIDASIIQREALILARDAAAEWAGRYELGSESPSQRFSLGPIIAVNLAELFELFSGENSIRQGTGVFLAAIDRLQVGTALLRQDLLAGVDHLATEPHLAAHCLDYSVIEGSPGAEAEAEPYRPSEMARIVGRAAVVYAEGAVAAVSASALEENKLQAELPGRASNVSLGYLLTTIDHFESSLAAIVKELNEAEEEEKEEEVKGNLKKETRVSKAVRRIDNRRGRGGRGRKQQVPSKLKSKEKSTTEKLGSSGRIANSTNSKSGKK